WAPNLYTLNDQMGAEVICSGKDAGAAVPGALMARRAFAKEHPDLVAKYLAVYLRAISYQKAHPQEFKAYLKKFFDANAVNLTDKWLAVETERPIYTLDEQLGLLRRTGGGKSKADGWFEELSGYLKSVGTIQQVPDPKTYISDEYLQLVDKDPKLKA